MVTFWKVPHCLLWWVWHIPIQKYGVIYVEEWTRCPLSNGVCCVALLYSAGVCYIPGEKQFHVARNNTFYLCSVWNMVFRIPEEIQFLCRGMTHFLLHSWVYRTTLSTRWNLLHSKPEDCYSPIAVKLWGETNIKLYTVGCVTLQIKCTCPMLK
jgi:hypothetical protein